MRMQESLAWVDGEDGRLRLSGVLSEWLFSSKFWSELNTQHGTIFDQFEEDEADVMTVKVVVELLKKRILALQKSEECNIEFVYRWTHEHEPAEAASVSKKALLSELTVFHNFLVDALEKNHSVIFSL